MKALPVLGFALCCSIASAQTSLLINEVQPANGNAMQAFGEGFSDWIEIYNGTNRTIDMVGMRLVVPGHVHVIDAPLKVLPKSFKLLWCDGLTDKGPAHLSFKLPGSGGSILLIAADGIKILDVFTWPHLFSGESLGRSPDGAKSWKLFAEPTPGTSNSRSKGTSSRPSRVTAAINTEGGSQRLTLHSDSGTIHFTTDGSEPKSTNGRVYDGPMVLDHTTTIRARVFEPSGVGGPEMTRTIFIDEGHDVASIIVDSLHLWDRRTGINVNGPAANHSRSGRAWERPGYFQSGPEQPPFPVGIRISGSGSRSYPKRSFKLYTRKRYGSPDAFNFKDGNFDELMLRADATPNAFLRNLLMERVVLRNALHVAMQPSDPLQLFINDNYQGLYRSMPPKDAQWLKSISGAKELEVVEGPGLEVITGSSNEHLLHGLQHLKAGAPIDTLKEYFGLNSLIDMACIDLFTGRADHDLNVRMYRTLPDGVWRWVLFDLDLWAPAQDNSLERILSSQQMGSPYLPQIMAHEHLRPMFLSRMETLMASAFDPAYTAALADSLFNRYRMQMQRDHERWKVELQQPAPEASLQELKEFLSVRGEAVLEQLAEYSEQSLKIMRIEVPDRSLADLYLNGMKLSAGLQELHLFKDVPVMLEVIPQTGKQFNGWSGYKSNDRLIELLPGQVQKLKPRIK